MVQNPSLTPVIRKVKKKKRKRKKKILIFFQKNVKKITSRIRRLVETGIGG